VEPSSLTVPLPKAVQAVIERNLIDRVVPSVGLVVTLWDIQSIEGGTIYPSDGAAHYDVTFRLVIFRPFEGEVLVGKLIRSDKTGVWISLGFFSDVFVPAAELQEPSMFISEEGSGVWRWDYEGEQLFLDLFQEVRLRVKQVQFNPIPTPAEMKEGLGTPAMPFKAMEVIGTMNEDGLGAVSWWESAEEAE